MRKTAATTHNSSTTAYTATGTAAAAAQRPHHGKSEIWRSKAITLPSMPRNSIGKETTLMETRKATPGKRRPALQRRMSTTSPRCRRTTPSGNTITMERSRRTPGTAWGRMRMNRSVRTHTMKRRLPPKTRKSPKATTTPLRGRLHV